METNADDVPLSAQQQEKLSSLRQAASSSISSLDASDAPYWSSDGALLRFLVARKWDVPAAAAQYSAAMAWRAAPAPEAAPGVRASELLDKFREPLAMQRYKELANRLQK